MATIRILFGLALALWLAAAPAHAQGDYFAGRTITILVPFPPGGSSDVVTRAISAKVAERLKANIVIDNRGGGGGVVAALAAKQAAPVDFNYKSDQAYVPGSLKTMPALIMHCCGAM